MTELDAKIEIDHERGVIYVHLANEEDARRLGIVTILRISQLPRPIPPAGKEMMDVTHMHGANWE